MNFQPDTDLEYYYICTECGNVVGWTMGKVPENGSPQCCERDMELADSCEKCCKVLIFEDFDGGRCTNPKCRTMLTNKYFPKAAVLVFSKEKLESLNKLLEQTRRVDDEPKDIIETFTVKFKDGREADIKVVNGSEDSGPYIDAVLFEDGQEIAVCEPVFDELDGDYHFFLAEHHYWVKVTIDEKETA